MTDRVVLLVAVLALAACGEDPEAAYERGYETGWADACDAIGAFSSQIEHALERQRIC